ncbi:hypothetical protein DYB26_009687 [Aphanomyces astaci]|nr:hypothetical protein AaE_008138 [Aphanomyces astaci]RHY54822.1 hypothetical protein DYB34_013838 [Aphanomyces astaci]RHY77413.1 hypothetical protein DYB38_006681 [Aphanomyces astaci]RHZ37926.1 hypothetical protein DYB26_009687 [Aphanomyces astaci]
MGFKHKFDLEKQVTFYMSYHSDPTNKTLHLLCIWPILLSAIFLLCTTAPFVDVAQALHPYVVANAALVGVLIYVLWYIVLDPYAGTLAAALIVSMYVWSNVVIADAVAATGESPWRLALGIHVTAWIIQFIGHGVFEKRAPALLDAWDQAIITAPLFVLLEVLWVFGYRREMQARIEAQVAVNVATFKRERAQRLKASKTA